MTTRDFRLYWWAGSTDALGTQASGLALPLLLLATGTSPAVVGLLAGASMACGLLLAPFAAVLADRGARRTVMLASALVSAAAMASIAAVAAWSVPALWHLFAAVAVERVATSCYEAAARGTLAVIVPPSGYTAAVSRLQAGEQAALVVGPLLGGALFQLARWLPFVADAASYLVTAVCVRAMRSDLRSAPDARQPDAAPGRAP
ncbi:MFS transporter, partial [Streptomyces sparsus]